MKREPLYRRESYSTVTFYDTETGPGWVKPLPNLTSNSATPVWVPVGDLWFGFRPRALVIVGTICTAIGYLLGSAA